MAAIITRRKWTRQPTQFARLLDGNQLAQSLTFTRYGSLQLDLVSGAVGTFAGSAAFRDDVGGLGVHLTGGASDQMSWTGYPSISGSQPFTIEVLLSLTATASLAQVFGLGQALPGYNTGSIGRQSLTYGGSSPFDIYSWGGSADVDSTVAWSTNGLPQHVFITFDGTAIRFYRAGAQIGTTGSPSLNASGTVITIGSRHYNGTGTITGTVYKTSFYNRQLSLGEIEALTDAPYQIYARTRRLYFGAAASGNVGSAVGASTATGVQGYIGSSTGASAATGVQGYVGRATGASTASAIEGYVAKAVGASAGSAVQGYIGEATGGSVVSGVSLSSSNSGVGSATGASVASGVSGAVGVAEGGSVVAGVALSSAAGYYPPLRKKRRILIGGHRFDVKDDYELDYLLHTLLDKRPEEVERTPKELRRVAREPVTRVVVPKGHEATPAPLYAAETYIRLVKQAGEDQSLQIALDRVWTARMQAAQREWEAEDEREVEMLVNAVLSMH